MSSEPLPQRGYLWQRDWTPAVNEALAEAQRRLQGLVLLGAEIEWVENRPTLVRATIDWEAVKARTKPCALALRLTSRSGFDAAMTDCVCAVARSLLDEARAHDVIVTEFQLDFDCAQKSLTNYRAWLPRLRRVVHPVRFVITTLPAWLDEPEFAALVREADGYVLQVHSVPLSNGRAAMLIDTQAARSWATKAAHLRLPFSVALPTYRCTAGFDATGKLLSVAMDSVQPRWPPNTRTLELAADPDAIATLVNEWQHERPPELRELIWYRIPVITDARNWRWATLSAVMSGRKPTHQLELLHEGENPIDLTIRNRGESDEEIHSAVMATWSDRQLIAADALAGWDVSAAKDRALFALAAGRRTRLPPGASRSIGWLRYDAPAKVQLRWMKENGTTPYTR